MFAYIVEQDYVQTTDSITKLLIDDKCISSYATCESLQVNENIHYEGHVIRSLKSQCDIDNLPMGSVLLKKFEEGWWGVLKCDYDITINNKGQSYFYDLNNKT